MNKNKKNDPKKCHYNKWMHFMGNPFIEDCNNCSIKCEEYNQKGEKLSDKRKA